MRILFLAPEPFYQERGTPIAINLLLKALSERGDQVDVVTYHEGQDVLLRGVTLHRTTALPFLHNIRPGFSWKKIVCDALMLVKSGRLLRRRHYDVIFAVEESVFIALLWKWIFKVPYVYDMDSCLVQQMTDQYSFLRPFVSLLNLFERVAVRNAIGVAPVCAALAAVILTYRPKKIVILEDVSVLPNVETKGRQPT